MEGVHLLLAVKLIESFPRTLSFQQDVQCGLFFLVSSNTLHF